MAILFLPRVICLLVILTLALPAVGRAQDKAKKLEATLRQLEKEIAAVRGLAFKKPVAARVIPRPKGGTKGVQGYYSLKDKTLYLYDDIPGNYGRGVLIHEMVHALQDQHFGLKKLHDASSTDADLARAALIEGDATFTMIEVLKKEQPKVSAMLKASLEKAKNLRNTFLYTSGAQYVKRLKDKGGWEAVNARYRFPPDATAAILSPEGANTITLGPGRRVGALAWIEHFADHSDARALVINAVKGLIADRIVEDGVTKSWQLAFNSREHAVRFQNAYAAFEIGQHPKVEMLHAPAGVRHWRLSSGKVHGVSVRGSRVAVVSAPDGPAYRSAMERLEGPLNLSVWSAAEKRHLSFGELADRLLNADLVCIGESHDNELCHRVQLQIIKALHARDERLGVGMEMFQRPFQDSLDKFSRGDLTEDEMLKATEYRSRWGYHWSLYQPIVHFCKTNRVPLAALNVPKELTAKLSKDGFNKLSPVDKKALGPIDFQVKAHRDYWYDRLARMHGKAKVSEERKERSYQVMTAWDEYMGASAAAFQTSRHLRRMIVLAGSGHIDLGFGIPGRAAKRTGGKTATVHVAPGGDMTKLTAAPPADFVVVVR